MVIVMQEGATDAQIQNVIDRLVAGGFNVHRSTGESHTVLGAVGVHRDFDHRDFELLDGVREVMRITQPFKLASRQFKPEGTVINLGRGVFVGGNDVVVARDRVRWNLTIRSIRSPRVLRKRERRSCAPAHSSRGLHRMRFKGWAKKASS